MQTFLPYPSFPKSAACLDRQRLGKQRVEAWQILRALDGTTKGWRNHPATKMWAGYEAALATYGLVICYEWAGRGYVDNMAPRFQPYILNGSPEGYKLPPWFGSPAFHSSHRSQLLHKSDHYLQFGWTEQPGAPYLWPSDKTDANAI